MPQKRNSNTTTTIPKRGKKKEVFPETVTDNTELAINEILKDGNNQQSKSTSTKRGCNKKETVASCKRIKNHHLHMIRPHKFNFSVHFTRPGHFFKFQ
ncbi:hypothetical protein RirG_073230 [Rhizophagus irregularis DAOM 197198w]|uniref:Uncharacterized protein n=2 Tax=Rhizophagus irregularis TaxID=588596 RepID=A0A015MZ01_RHIIW|nr:hypothetical protein RirG_073230 [Rhizophagus irregularis DAOM 197198w]